MSNMSRFHFKQFLRRLFLYAIFICTFLITCCSNIVSIPVSSYQTDYETDYGTIIINAENKTQEQVAQHLINLDTEFTVTKKQGENDYDNLMVTYYQNPLTPTITSYAFKSDSTSVTYYVTFKESTNLLRKWQKYEYTSAKSIANVVNKKYKTTKEKVIAINSWICNKTEYNTYASEITNKSDAYIQSQSAKTQSAWRVYGCTKYNYCVCSGYANAFKLICDFAGIECVNVTGSANGVRHLWNKVKINNAWYLMDCTFNDSEIKNSCRLVSDKIAYKHIADKSGWCMQGKYNNFISTKSYDYYNKKTFLLENLDDYFSWLNHSKITCTTIRLDSSDTVNNLLTIRSALKKCKGYKSYKFIYNSESVFRIEFEWN